MSTHRWKLATLVFAAATAVLALRGPADAVRNAPARSSVQTPVFSLRKVHVPAQAMGLDEASLVAELRAERDARRVILLCNKLAIVGSDLAVDALTDFADDKRSGVAAAALMAIGDIGTDSALAFLLGFERDGVARFRSDAMRGLAKTLRDEARVRLIEIAKRRDDNERLSAVAFLGVFEHVDTVKALTYVAETADFWTARTALRTLGELTLPEARTALLGQLRSPDARLVAMAIESIEGIGTDKESRERLVELIEVGDATIVAAAVTALGRAGDRDVLPILEEVARTGAEAPRTAAIDAIAELGGADSIALLGRLLAAGDLAVARSAANALIYTGEDEARALLVQIARKQTPTRVVAIQALRDVRGGEVEELMLDVARTGTREERRIAFQSLIEGGHPRGFELAVAAARGGADGTWPVDLISSGPSAEARRALSDLARSAPGDIKLAALGALADIGLDANARTTLGEVLAHGDDSAKRSAAGTLARAGSPEARAMLLAAVGDKDRALANAAIRVMLDADGSPAARDAIVAAARSSSALREQAIDTLLEHGAPQGVALARDTLTSSDEHLATQAANALGRAGDATATDALLAGAASPHPGARRAVAEALAERGDPRSRDALAKLATDRDAEVRHAAYGGLAEVGTREAVDTLGRVATTGDEAERRAAIDALGSVDGDVAHDALARVLTTERDPALVLAAIREARTGGAVLNDALVTVLRDPAATAEIRQAAAERLDSVGALDDADRHLLLDDTVD